MSELVRLMSVVKEYNPDTRIDIRELSLAEGDRVRVAGANGSGKSTLLRLVAGLSVPTTGTVWRSDRWPSTRIGYLPQAGGLYDHLSVRANFEVRQALYRSAPARDAIVERLTIGPWLSTKAGDLSGGYRRLVALAAALIVAPDVLILDEPFDGVDATRRAAVLELLGELAPSLALLIVAAPAHDDPMPSMTSVIQLEQGRAWTPR